MLTVACVQVGNYCDRGAEYVNILHDAVFRNLGVPHRFVCLTDDPTGLHKRIETITPPPGVTGWWAKLYLFDVLREGPVLYLDLDTVLTGHIDPLAQYEGRFAILRDFYRPGGYQSAVMAWNGDQSHIWQSWVEAGRPLVPGGDQAWIERVVEGADRLQDLHPGRILSFKVHAREWILADAMLVCFHGHPRPHEVTEGWVPELWKVGGLTQPRFIQTLNTPIPQMLGQAERNLARGLPMFVGAPEHKGKALIVGGAPSLSETLTTLRLHRARKGVVFAVNAVHDYLIERGIVPDYHVMLDARAENAQFVSKPHRGVKYLIAAQCHPDVFDALAGYDVTVWCGWVEGMVGVAERHPHLPITLVGGGNTVVLKTWALAQLMGFRRVSLFGVDSSYRGDANHAYPQPLNDGEAVMDVVVEGRTFKAARWMARQAHDFQQMANRFVAEGGDLTVYGDGLIPWIAKCMAKEKAA